MGEDGRCHDVLRWAVGVALRDTSPRSDPEPGRRPTTAFLGTSGPRLVALAEVHGVTGYLGRALAAAQATPDARLADHLRARRAHAVGGHLRCLEDLAIVGAVLDREGIPWAGVKGPYLTELAHGAAHLRSYADLDVLIAPGSVRSAVHALLSAGATPGGPAPSAALGVGIRQLGLVLPGGTRLDLHWDLVNDERRAAQLAVPPAAVLLARRRLVDLGGTAAWALDDVDAVLHVALHATTSGGARLIWPLDVERSLRTVTGRGVLRDRAASWGAALPVACALSGVRQQGGALPPSAEGFDGLLGHPWVRLTAAARSRDRTPLDAPHMSVARWLSRSTRRTGAASAAEAAGYAVAVAGRVRARRSLARLSGGGPPEALLRRAAAADAVA